MTEQQDIERLRDCLTGTLEIIDQTLNPTLRQSEEIQEAHAVLAEVSEAMRKREDEA